MHATSGPLGRPFHPVPVPEHARPRRRRVLVAALAAPLLALAACGGGSASSGSSGGSSTATVGSGGSAASEVAFPVTVTAGNGQVSIPAKPAAIVSLSPSLTEMLYDVGAGSQVKAVDDQSNFPAQAPRTKLSGFEPSAEAVAGYGPDLVVASNDTKGVVAALTKLKIPVLLLPAPTTLEESFTQEIVIASATGHLAQGQAAIEKTKQRIDAAVTSVPKAAKPLKIYHELDQNYYSVTSKTFIGSLYGRFGLQNIADTSPKAAGGYPQLSAEFVVSAGPDVIVLADGNCCGQSPDLVSKRPAFASVPAVAARKVVLIDDDIASRWGPRTADFAEALAKALRG